MRKIAVLITCHNRREKTLACLVALYKNFMPEDYTFEVFLVDDGSTDGTEKSVRERYPQVDVIRGDGNLYWNGGMRVAFAAAIKKDFDYYLWLNDDTLLDSDVLARLLICKDAVASMSNTLGSIIVGATCDPITGILTYGGLVQKSSWQSFNFVKLPVSTIPQLCVTMNGNCVLIPREVVHKIGNLDSNFVHSIGDWDYGLRARKAGFSLWMAPGFVGSCASNPPRVQSKKVAGSVVEQLRLIADKKQLPPMAWYIYVRRHCGILFPLFFVRPYFSVVVRALFAKIRGVVTP